MFSMRFLGPRKQENMTKENALDEAIKDIHKQFGKGSLMAMADHRAAEPVEIISSRNTIIDELTGIGGIARGRVTEVFGPEGGGKTTLALQLVAEAQSKGGVVAYIDAEHSLDIEYARALGVDVDKMLISQPDCGEEAIEIALALTKSGGVTLVVIDSVAALIPKAELEGSVEDQQIGLQGRLMSKSLRMMVGAVKSTGTAMVFINQIRDKIGVMFGSPETTSGGRALKFYSSLRLDLRRISQIKKGDTVIGQNVKIKSVKNKLSAPYRSADVELLYGLGFQNE